MMIDSNHDSPANAQEILLRLQELPQ